MLNLTEGDLDFLWCFWSYSTYPAQETMLSLCDFRAVEPMKFSGTMMHKGHHQYLWCHKWACKHTAKHQMHLVIGPKLAIFPAHYILSHYKTFWSILILDPRFCPFSILVSSICKHGCYPFLIKKTTLMNCILLWA